MGHAVRIDDHQQLSPYATVLHRATTTRRFRTRHRFMKRGADRILPDFVISRSAVRVRSPAPIESTTYRGFKLEPATSVSPQCHERLDGGSMSTSPAGHGREGRSTQARSPAIAGGGRPSPSTARCGTGWRSPATRKRSETYEALALQVQAGGALPSLTVTLGLDAVIGGPHRRVRRSEPRTGRMLHCIDAGRASHRQEMPSTVRKTVTFVRSGRPMSPGAVPPALRVSSGWTGAARMQPVGLRARAGLGTGGSYRRVTRQHSWRVSSSASPDVGQDPCPQDPGPDNAPPRAIKQPTPTTSSRSSSGTASHRVRRQHHVGRTLEYISHSNKPSVPKPVATDPGPTRF